MTYEQEMEARVKAFMMARIKRVQGKESHFDKNRNGYRFFIKEMRRSGPTTRQIISLDTDDENEALLTMYNRCNRKG